MLRKFFIALIFLIILIISAACSCAYAADGSIVTGETKDLLNNLNINNVNDFAIALIN
ncbi:MAG: hypothetical protein IJ576_02675 [Synergistaceae bacterium]|nr:hypothetical protein [Synergistaceae bacterium]